MRSLFKKEILVVLVILGVAFLLRIYNIGNLSLYGDELTIAQDSYSILKTAHSSTGQFLPLTFEMGAGRPGGYVYGSVPFVALFGPSDLGVRMLSILSGILIILLVYLLAKLFINKKVALVAAAIMAISPWDLSLSRGGFESHFALMLALLGTYTFLLATRTNWLFLISALCFGLTIHTYPTYKLVLPLFLILLLWYKGREKLKEVGTTQIGAAVILVATLVLVAGYQTLISGSEDRFLNINLFGREDIKQEVIQEINLDRNLTEAQPRLIKLLHNKPLEYTDILIKSYVENFSADFLFLKGDLEPRHNMAGVGSFYLIEFLTILVGLFYLWSTHKRLAIFLTGWLLVSPLGATLLLETHALRSAFMLPVLILFSASGLMYLFSELGQKGKILGSLVVLVIFIQLIFIFENLYFLLPNKYSRFWSDSAKTASHLANDAKDDYDLVILSDKIDNIEYAYQVYNKVDPNLIIAQQSKRENLGGYQFKRFDNVYIGSIPRVNLDRLVSETGKKVLYIGSPVEDGSLTDYEILKGKDDFDSLVVKKYL